MDITGIGSVADAFGKVIDKIWPDATEAQKAKDALNAQLAQGQLDEVLGQLKINLAEAQSTNWFVAGWRPFVGWVCGMGLAYSFLIMPLANGMLGVSHFPALDNSTLMTCLGGMLGLGTLRTVEKHQDCEGNR